MYFLIMKSTFILFLISTVFCNKNDDECSSKFEILIKESCRPSSRPEFSRPCFKDEIYEGNSFYPKNSNL